MDFASISAFNARKAATHRALYPAQVEFAALPGVVYDVSFGETENNAELHASGQGIDALRIGLLYFPLPAAGPAFVPAAGMSFVVTVSAQPGVQGQRYQVQPDGVRSSPGESVVRCRCTRVEE